jgi:ferric-dicitrate binding protein FerR (iron transport regulator)
MTESGFSTDGTGYDEVRLRHLIDALCDHAISPAEQVQLEAMLLASEGARIKFLDDMCLHASLEWEGAANAKLEELFDFCSGQESCLPTSVGAAAGVPHTLPAKKSLRRIVVLAAAACLLLVTSVWLLPSVRQFFGGSEPTQSAAATPVVATLSPASRDSRWMIENESIFEQPSNPNRSAVVRGERLRVTGGTLSLKYQHGTTVTLTAPAILEIVSPMRGRLIRGRATVNVARGAEGFTIDTPRTSVVDLGTVFGVEVDDFGGTDVVVFSGMIDLAYSRDVQNSANAEVGTQRLYMGEAVRVDARGTLSRIISLNSNRFGASPAESPTPLSRAPVISSVRDNINREDAWNFYEIVPGGMREDAKAFVDRLHHEWNGMDSKGMPPYLVGADYVKLFNDDKNIGEKEVFVELERPATLYVLWCKRIPSPAWLREQFEDTGDEIGVDEGRHVFKDGNVHNRDGPGTGPGVSVDSIHTVWRLVVTEPSTVRLGPTEAPGWDFNVYGIVAVSLQAAGR